MNQPKFLQTSEYATDFLISFTDGIMIPLALAAAMSTIIPNPHTIIWVCILEILLMGSLMGIASYFTIINQAEENMDLIPEIKNNNPNKFVPHLQLKEILNQLELGKDALQRADHETVQYHKHWTETLEKFNIGRPMPDFERAGKSGIMVGISFLLGGIIPVISYFFVNDSMTGLQFALVLSLAGLIGVAIFKASYTGISAWKESLRLIITCLVMTGVTFLVFYLLNR